MEFWKFVGFLMVLFSIVFFGAFLESRKEARNNGRRHGDVLTLIAGVAMLLLGLYLMFN